MGQPAPKSSSELSDLLAKVSDIRTLPFVAVKVNELINDPNTSSSDIAEVLKKDQVLTAKVLRLVNSSYYAIPGGVADVQRALAFLGFNTIAQLILSLSVFSVFTEFEHEDFSLPQFWKHALGAGFAAEILARRIKLPKPLKPEEAFTCGLLHDVGKLVMHEVDQPRFMEIVQQSRAQGASFVEIERARDIPSHAYIGEVIATRWGLPQVIRQAIRYHHHDVTKMDSILASVKPMIQVVRLANQLCVRQGVGQSGDCSKGEISPDMLLCLKLSMADVAEVEVQLAQEINKAGALLNAYR